MRVLIAALVVVAAALPGRASAGMRALAPAPAAGPALLGDRVLWGEARRLLAAPVAGGAAATFGTDVPARDASLAAGSGQVAVRAGTSLFAAGADGRFTRVLPDAGEAPIFPVVPSLQPTAAGLVVLEDGGVNLRGGRRRVEVALPPGADPEHVAAAGSLGVAPVPEGALVVFSLFGGVEERQISLGPYDGFNVSGLAISPAGDVAATVPVGDGTDVLVWSPAGSERVRVLARGQRFGRVATAGGRIAFVGGVGLREGVRVVVVDATGRVVLRGPPTVDVSSVTYDGRFVAFSTPTCLLLASSSRFTIPAGPCMRSDVAVDVVGGRIRVACINAPSRRCRVRARGVTALVPRGSARVLPVSARGRVSVRVTDPDGRSRTIAL